MKGVVEGLPPPGAGGPFDHPIYVTASASHEKAVPAVVPPGFAVLREESGGLHSVYGYPQPWGDPMAVAVALGELDVPVRVTVAELGKACELVKALEAGGSARAASRPLAVMDLNGDDPLERFQRRARRAVGTAVKRSAIVRVGALEGWFGSFYRAAMAAMGAEGSYFFEDSYFAELAKMPHWLVTVEDQYGIASATLFLYGGKEAFYHLGGRRAEPEPVLGAMNLALLEGMREAVRQGSRLCMLGGGRSPSLADALYLFKMQMATRTVERPTFLLGAARQ